MRHPSLPIVEATRCTGCGRCVAACPTKLMTLDTDGFRKIAVIREKKRCTFCGECITACPLDAVKFPPE